MSKRQRVSGSSAGAAAAASSSQPPPRVVGSRRVARPPSPPADSPPAADDAIDVDASESDDDAWVYPDLASGSGPLSTLSYQFRLSPNTAPVFHKYDQASIDGIVGEVMKFILQRTSASQTVSHKDVLTVLRDRCKTGANSIMADARRRFMELFGYELKEIDRADDTAAATGAGSKRKASSAAAASSSNKSYILCSPLSESTPAGLRLAYSHGLSRADPDDSMATKGLLYWIYALIHAEESGQSGGGASGVSAVHGCPESTLWRQLSLVAHIERDKKNHEIFGDVAALIDEFVKQHYLVRVKVSADAGNNNSAAAAAAPATPTFSYRIGSRGAAEISTTSLYRGMCETIFGTAPNPAHLNQIKRNEELSRSRAGKPNAKPAAAPPAASQA